MNFITFEELRNYAAQEGFRKPFYRQLENSLDRLVGSGILNDVINNEHLFYPKYLWRDDKKLEIFFLTKDKIVTFKYENEDKPLYLETIFTKDINKIIVSALDNYKRDIVLNLYFKNGEEITFSSNDSNDSWKYKYYEVIKEIYYMYS